MKLKTSCQDQPRSKTIQTFSAEDRFLYSAHTRKTTSIHKKTTVDTSQNYQLNKGARPAKSKQEGRRMSTLGVNYKYTTPKTSFQHNKIQTLTNDFEYVKSAPTIG